VPSDRVLIISQVFYPELISTGQTMTELAETLTLQGVKVQVWRGPQTLVSTQHRHPKHLSYKGIDIYRLRGTQFPKLNFLGRVINQMTFALSVGAKLLSSRITSPIIVATNPPFLAPLCAMNRLLGGTHYIYLVFDLYPNTLINLGLIKPDGLPAKMWSWMNNLSYRYASKIVIIGRCMADLITPRMTPELKSKIEIIPVWADDHNISVAEGCADYRDKWQLSNRFSVGYSGNLGRFHDTETIIEAAKLLEDDSDFRFIFVGEGAKKAATQSMTHEYGLQNVIFDTYVPRSDLGHSLRAFDVGLVSLLAGQEGSSVPSKTFGLLAAGVPVVAVLSHKSEIARIITEEDCGIVVAPGDAEGLAGALKSLKYSKPLRDHYIENAKRAIERKYSLSVVAKRYQSLLKELSP
jgi:glycosyltransferase involved in cell wall biosynthesis